MLNDTGTTERYTYIHTLTRHDALPIYRSRCCHEAELRRRLRHLPSGAFRARADRMHGKPPPARAPSPGRSEEHTSELQSLMRISYAVFCLKKTIQTAQSTRPEYRHSLNANNACHVE